jgi:glucose/arabinose dehydrogenase
MSSRRGFLGLSAAAAIGTVTGCSSGTPAPPAAPASSVSTSSTPTRPPSSTPTPSAAPSTPSRTPEAAPSPEPTSVEPRVDGVIARNLDVPWGFAFLRSGQALVSERNTGRILRISADGKKTTLGEIDGVVPPSGAAEGGLMGIALAPGDEDTLFAYITTDSDDRLVRVSLAGGRIGRPRALLTDIPTSVHHHGGRLLFAPDRTLFLSTGDAEQSDSAQDRDALTGKILRLTTDGKAAAGNPFGNRTWSYGHRNIEGLAFDAQGRLWASEFGDKRADELNRIVKGGNYGWPDVEGRSDDDDFVQPTYTWNDVAEASPAGLAITRSTAFVGALRGRCLYAVPLDGTRAGKATRHFTGDYGRIRNAVAAPDGSLWMTTSNTDGRTDPGSGDDQILRVTL